MEPSLVGIEGELPKSGQLKIFFGACSGVGKTYAMLLAAIERKRSGVDVLVGWVDTHQIPEANALLRKLDVLPRTANSQFDLNLALERKPQLILVDDLAHTNAPGARHQKRFQDVQELLDEGIDVYTSLNVQHLESLNDIVGQITGLVVNDTIPDMIFNRADSVTIVDLPPDEILLRLSEGKISHAIAPGRAGQLHFRKGTLIALRELALRRITDRVDAQMQDYRIEQSIQEVWPTKERLLVSVGPGQDSEKLVRCAARLASNLKAEWHAVHIETPQLKSRPEDERKKILDSLRLAQTLGAETSLVEGAEIVESLLAFVVKRNISKIVIGQTQGSPLFRFMHQSLSSELAKRAKGVDLYIVGRDTRMAALQVRTHRLHWKIALWPVVGTFVTTLVAFFLSGLFHWSNLSMLYLLNVLLVTLSSGRGAGILTVATSMLAITIFLVPPLFSPYISESSNLITSGIFLLVALIISHLTARLRLQAKAARQREQRTDALYALGKELSAALTSEQIAGIGSKHIQESFPYRCAVLLPDAEGKLHFYDSTLGHKGSQPENSPEIDLSTAKLCYERGIDAGWHTTTRPDISALYLPLKAPMRTRGVLVLIPDAERQPFNPEQMRLLQTFAAQIALALERAHFLEVARDALVRMESERLRNSLLSAVSHDLRTPLTIISGLAQSLTEQKHRSEAEQQEILSGIVEESQRMNSMVINILDMARLQAGTMKINKQWQLIEEVVGSALRQCRKSLELHTIELGKLISLPLLEFDAVLMERVFCNILENAAKYSPPGGHISIEAVLEPHQTVISVVDEGAGIPPGMEKRIFEKFTRASKGSDASGVGLGLAICRTIIEAHGGKITASNRTKGACFAFTIPLGTAPALEPELELT